MKKQLLLIPLVLLLFSLNILAQIEVKFSEELSESMSNEDGSDTLGKGELEALFTQKLRDYRKYAKLINPNTGAVDLESRDKFKSLFTGDARLFNDLKEVPEAGLLSDESYMQKVKTYFPIKGHRFALNKATITKVENLGNLKYLFTVEVNKSIGLYYREDGRVETGDLNYDLEFLYRIDMKRSDNARIQVIRQVRGKIADIYSNYISGGLGMGLGQTNFTENVGEKGALDFNNSLDFSLNFSFYDNFFNNKKSANKSLFFVGGLSFFYQELQANLTNYSMSEDLNNIQGVVLNSSGTEQIVVNASSSFVQRRAANVNVSETQTMIGLRVPLGIGFRLLDNNTNSAFINVQYAPSLVINSSGNLVGNSGNGLGVGDYGHFISGDDISGNDYTSFDANAYSDAAYVDAYELGTALAITDSKPELSPSLSHGVLVSGTFFKDFIDDSPTFGVGIGVHYYLPLTNMYTNDFSSDNKPFLYPQSSEYIDSGVITPFIDNLKLGYIGLSISVYRKATRKP